MNVQIELVCSKHNRALTPIAQTKQPFGKQWSIYNLTVDCESGGIDCADTWNVVVNSRVIGTVLDNLT